MNLRVNIQKPLMKSRVNTTESTKLTGARYSLFGRTRYSSFVMQAPTFPCMAYTAKEQSEKRWMMESSRIQSHTFQNAHPQSRYCAYWIIHFTLPEKASWKTTLNTPKPRSTAAERMRTCWELGRRKWASPYLPMAAPIR